MLQHQLSLHAIDEVFLSTYLQMKEIRDGALHCCTCNMFYRLKALCASNSNHIHTHTLYTHIYIYIYIYVCVRVCVCVCVCVGSISSHTNFVQHNRHFLSTYVLVNPFVLPY